MSKPNLLSSKTHKKLTVEESRILCAKSAVHFDFRILTDIVNVLLNKVTDLETLNTAYDLLDDFITHFDNTLYNIHSNNETDNKEDTH